jgi:hypothetical protein
MLTGNKKKELLSKTWKKNKQLKIFKLEEKIPAFSASLSNPDNCYPSF